MEFKVGDTVEIQGLTKAEVLHLNGQKGTVSSPLKEGYYRVKLAGGKVLDVRPRHLRELSSASMGRFAPMQGKELGDCKNWTFIIPAVSVGNVAQIAVDLILATAKLEKIGYWYGPSSVPVLCNHPLATKPKKVKPQIALSVEFFRCSKRKVIVVQRRAPLVRGGAKSFVSKLLAWAKKVGFATTVLVSSTQAHYAENSHQKRFWCTHVAADQKLKEVVEELKIPFMSLDGSAPSSGDAKTSVPNNAVLNSLMENPNPIETKRGGAPTAAELLRFNTGMTKEFIAECMRAKIRTVALLAQVNEGDNMEDGQHMAQALTVLVAKLQGQDSIPLLPANKPMKIPFAYNHVYGPEPDRRIYT
mmetsp:Transcript_20521/g.41349  ORF Transcript_20521/g.41349 Transcript_20521/m.41349 type:complete len:359 (-) Transcript_20521:7-1083(-)